MRIHDFPQYSGEWWAARLGKITASGFGAIVTPEFAPRKGAMPETYLNKLVAERVLGFSEEQMGQSLAMSNGSIVETECFGFLGFEKGLDLHKVGFIESDDGELGFSPDGVGNGFGAEIKVPTTPVHVSYLRAQELPEAYRPQVFFSMLVGDFSHYYFCSYSRQLPCLLLRIERDPAIDAKIRAALDPFIARLRQATAEVKAMRDAHMLTNQPASGSRGD